VYVRRHKVRRGDRSYVYLRLVEAYRDEAGRVRHRAVATLGREDQLKASGQLDQLAASFARLDPPAAGTRRAVGPLLLVAHYLSRLGLVKLVDALAPVRGRAFLTHGEVTAVLAASRLCSPSPLYDIAGWASSAAVAELLGVPPMLLNDDRLGRALEALAPVAEQLRGELLLRAVREFPAADASRLHLDLTAVRFAGAYEDSALVARGWSADRTIKRQVKTLQASSPSGVAVYFRPHQGATGEPPAVLTAVEALAAALPAAPVIVADSGLGYLEHLCALDTKKVAFVVALRAGTGWAARFDADIGPAGGLAALAPLGYVSAREKRLPEDKRTRWKGLLAPFPVTRTNDDRQEVRHDLRAAYIWSSEEAATVAAARQRALDKAEDALTRVRNGLGGRYYKTRKQVDARIAQILTGQAAGLITIRTGTRNGKPWISWQRDAAAIAAASRLDGIYALATNLPDPGDRAPLTALDVLQTYKDQWIVEQRHRDLKQTLRVRPVFLHNDDRIAALIAVIGIALLIYGLIEAELRAALGPGATLPGILPEGRAALPTARAVLAAFDGLSLTYTPAGPILDRLTRPQRTILGLLDIPLPWPEQPGQPPKP
jgi:Domain of unknown function (DUF4277)/Transposase DDE domain